MSQSIMSVRVDEEDKNQFDKFCNDVGMNASVAVNMFVKTVVRTGRLPFNVELDPFYSKENQKRLKKSIESANAGKLTEHELVEE